MTILTVNVGSSSIKATLFKINNGKLLRIVDASAKGDDSFNSIDIGKRSESIKANSVKEAGQAILKTIFTKNSVDDVRGIGHRIVHGGSKFTTPVLLDERAIKEINSLSYLAPLHNEKCLEGVAACSDFFGESVPQIAVFDTAFHAAMPQVASSYAIPLEITEKYAIKRYGFHGISHRYLWETFSKHTKEKNAKIITLHLGNGCSATAIKDGQSIDTSMGFTPAEGLVMGTRAGDIDSAIVDFLCQHEKKQSDEVMSLLNHQSGLQGVSGISSNMKEVMAEYDTNAHARLAVDLFCYRIIKYIGSYHAVLNKAEAIIFAGGIGENASKIRSKVAEGLEWMGVEIDENLNSQAISLSPGDMIKISLPQSKTDLFVIGTDEDYLIAKEVLTNI